MVDIVFAIPIVWIIVAGCQKMMQMHINYKLGIPAVDDERHEEQRAVPDASQKALVDEVARLRETTTQYDLSIQHTLEQIQHRLSILEARDVAVTTDSQRHAVISEQPAILTNGHEN